MKATFKISVGSVEMEATRDMPFVPSVGNMVAVTPGGDFFRIEDVYWHCQKPEEIIVYLSDEDKPAAQYLKKQGWQVGK